MIFLMESFRRQTSLSLAAPEVRTHYFLNLGASEIQMHDFLNRALKGIDQSEVELIEGES